jgi:hypothetical protein
MGEACRHRRDATCCLGHGRLASKPEDEVAARLTGGCGSCGNAAPEPHPPLLQIERLRPRPSPRA